MNRRLMNTVVSTTSSAGVSEASSCAAATIEAPANTTIDISIATGGAMPLATMATPVMMPKATTPGSAASAARAPARRSLLAAVFADAGLQLFAALVLAGLAQLLAVRHALLVGLRVLGLRAIEAALLGVDRGAGGEQCREKQNRKFHELSFAANNARHGAAADARL